MKIKALLCVVCCLLLITTACGTTKTKSENQSDKKAFENIANKDESAIELKESRTKIEYIEEQMEMKIQGYVEGGFLCQQKGIDYPTVTIIDTRYPRSEKYDQYNYDILVSM